MSAMKIDHWIRAIAGMIILKSVGPGWPVNKHRLLSTAFIGLNLLQSAFTKWCFVGRSFTC